MSINSVHLSGNLTRDSELKTLASGSNVLQFGLAVNERRKSPQTGEWEDVPAFFDCAIFGKRAEKLAPYLAKGTKVAVAGRLRYSSWTDKQSGQKRSKVDVAVDEIEFMSRTDGRQVPQQRQAQYQPQYRQQQLPYQPQAQANDAYDSSIPF
ncbi:single-stranded DNA-binding protein [Olsenella phocaeensis]|uniref:single-stranded DNA-binding protein n=1 Tax=Olsenella phocaeensis TaxID=1852385 RepID=UPI000931FF1B|nr:single-stranded DNA-binding protein [Olsenella phocaeensis]